MEELVDRDSALPEGSTIIGGQYRLVELLHQRPRVNLYLGRRLSQRHNISPQDEPLVAIRELVLTDLNPQLRKHIEQAAFEEFVSPITAPGIPRLPGAFERIDSEGYRHYLVSQFEAYRVCGWIEAMCYNSPNGIQEMRFYYEPYGCSLQIGGDRLCGLALPP